MVGAAVTSQQWCTSLHLETGDEQACACLVGECTQWTHQNTHEDCVVRGYALYLCCSCAHQGLAALTWH
jgi:hypothetical protein